MEFVRSLRRLWHHQYFCRLLAVRVATQSCDGLLQIALASYVLFSPERQPDAASLATVLAITLLPFSVLGPFVGVVLDRWSRRQILVVIDLCRAALVLGLAGLAATGLRNGQVETLFYGVVLLAMSLNRFLLAALSSSLPHTIDPDEYLVANSVVPTVGPAGVLIGVAAGTGLRLLLGGRMEAYQADALLFVVAAVGYVFSAALALRIPRRRLGPDQVSLTGPGDVLAGLADALRHLGDRRAAALGLGTIGAHRIIYGIVTVAMILAYRNYFHRPHEVDAAIGDLGLLVAVTGAGFVFAAVVTPPATARIGVRAWMVATLAGSALFQVVPGAIYAQLALLVAAFLLGVTAQSLKICVDTLVQAHVEDDYKGRVFVLYDMVFNVALVVAAGIGAQVLPANGKSVAVLVVLAGCYLAVGALFALASRGLNLNEGTESLTSELA
ncbi:MFS transporter [Microlunatus panaciterrae]|uniref:MFS family permease n=1 Tax=Microlunatus panaciterrae TaxID=400768 RepID=A0ABS2RIR7_9ACTN|nr:MFS transporter [Microlunatus panaciterrae]MBM7798894.1 MFS family permease [Microlunatus panaciterrae]